MKALIMAAGKGTRLGELTKTTPKPMLEIAGKPLLDHIVTNLEQAGVKDIIIKVDYLKEAIMDYFGKRAIYIQSGAKHFESLEIIRPFVDGQSFFVCNGDTINNVDYRAMVKLGYTYATEIIELVDEWRCAGTWLYPASFYEYNPLVFPYRQPNLKWHDTGTPERLTEARKAWA